MKRSATRSLAAAACCLMLGLAAGAHAVRPPGSQGGAPSAPTGLSAALVFPHHVGLSWNANPEPDVAGYNVYRSTAPKGGYLKVTASPLPGTSFLDTAVAVGTTYYYKVTAVNAAGSEGKQSAVVAIAVAEVPDTFPPGYPLGFDARGAYGTVSLSWTNPPDDDFAGTTVRYDLSGYPSGPQGGLPVCDRPAAPGSGDSFTHGGLENGRTYYYAAFSYDRSGNYSAGVTASAAPVDNVFPVISGVGADNVTSSGATIRWTTDEPADSQVEYGVTAAYGSATPLDASMTTAHVVPLSGLAPATLYHYRVGSADALGNRSVSEDRTFATAPLTSYGCRECHGAPQYEFFASGGHGKPGIALSCETCHTSGTGHTFVDYKELKTVNGFAYPAVTPDLMATVDARKGYCLSACHAPLPGGEHPTGYDEIVRYATWTYIEILSPEGYVQKYGSYPGTTLPASPALRLLDVDGNGGNSYGDIVMCTTCHEVHGTSTGYFMIPIAPGPDNSIQPLCTQCHPY